MTGRTVVLMGGGGFGTFARDLAVFAGWEPAGILDNNLSKGTLVNGCPVLGDLNLLEDAALREKHHFIASIQKPSLRRDWSRRVLALGGRLATIIHPSVARSPSAAVGAGVMINAFSFAYANARVGDFCIVESHCSVGTEVEVGECSMLAPGVLVNRAARIGDECFVGSGAVLNPDVVVGRNCLIGANATVVKNLPDNVVAAGSPARILRENSIS
ncbi:MAG: NeuD/PglB/VioB family sugar acetyltransferase [Rhodobacteraceae bacterium]|nr:NeuD/PglB/VioB family sugar acetyltransferase [Paracoccaceae bacterium]